MDTLIKNTTFTTTPKTTATETESTTPKSLRDEVLSAMQIYFQTQGHELPDTLNSFVLEEVESAMYEGVMKFTKGNQVKAAKVLGVSRGTLRTKLKQYFDSTHVGGLYHSWEIKNPRS